MWGFAGSWRLWGFDQLGVDHVSGCAAICRDDQPAPSAVGTLPALWWVLVSRMWLMEVTI